MSVLGVKPDNSKTCDKPTLFFLGCENFFSQMTQNVKEGFYHRQKIEIYGSY